MMVNPHRRGDVHTISLLHRSAPRRGRAGSKTVGRVVASSNEDAEQRSHKQYLWSIIQGTLILYFPLWYVTTIIVIEASPMDSCESQISTVGSCNVT